MPVLAKVLENMKMEKENNGKKKLKKAQKKS